MSHKYSKYSGGLNGPPNTQDTNEYESLTGSLIYPDRRIPIQQSYQQTWSDGQSWPNYVQESNKYETRYRAPSVGNGEYSSNNQEYIPYDEGEDFYDNGDGDTGREVEQGGQTFKQSGHIPTSRGSNPSNLPNPSTSRTDEQQRLHSVRPEVATPKPDSAALNERAAELRAKLLATKRGSTPGTPSSLFKKTTECAPKSRDDSNGSTEALTNSLSKQLTSDNQRVLNVANKKPMATKVDKAHMSSLMRSDGSSDIDALFAEARAANAARTAGVRSNHKSTSKDRGEEKPRGSSTHATLKPDPQPEAAMSKDHRPSNKNRSSSDASELGEIRDDQSKKAGAPYPEPSKPKDSGHGIGTSDGKPNVQIAADNISKGQPTDAIDTATTNSSRTRAGRTSMQPRDASTTHKSPGSISGAQRSDNQASNAEYRRERFEQLQLTQDSRYKQDHDPTWKLGHSEKGNHVSGQQQTRTHASETERISTDRPRHYEHEFQTLSKKVDKNARTTAVYKRELEDKARQLDSAQNKAERVETATATDIRGSRERPALVSKATISAENPVAADHRRSNHIADRKPLEKAPQCESVVDVGKKVVESTEDLNDWLELTSYYDVQLRNQRLALFREMKATDAHRAELQRQAEQLGIVRTQSIRPQESDEEITSRNIAFSQNPSALAMPPQSVPLQEHHDDLGIKIKNSANRENTSSAQKLKRAHVDDDLGSGHRLSKSQRLESSGRSGQARPQLSSTSLRREQMSVKNRISVDDRDFPMEFRERSRSPQPRHKSFTSPTRRRERPISPTRHDVAGAKPEPECRENLGSLREYEANPQDERHNRNMDYNPRWNSYRPNTHHYENEPHSTYRERGRGGRGGYHTNTRGGYRPQRHDGEIYRGEGFRSATLNLQAGGQSGR